METSVKSTKQRNKRRERAQRMQAEREKDADGVGVDVIADGDDSDDDSKKKSPIRPPQRRKKAASSVAVTNNNIKDNNNSTQFKEPSPILEEEVVDGFAILSFKTYEDLEYAIKLANKRNEKRLSAITELTTIMTEDQLPKLDTGQIKQEIDRDGRERERKFKNNNHTNFNSSYSHDPGTSDDSGRASERLTTSSVAQRDQDSSRDRLSDASSRCSSGKGYICDSEGDDDKTSDGGSTSGAVVQQRKTADIYPTTGVPPSINNGPIGFGGNLSPSNRSSPAAPSPAPAALPPPFSSTQAPAIQEMNESIGTDMTSLSNHVDIKSESNSNNDSVPNGNSKVKPASPKKTSKSQNSNSNNVVKEEEPSNDGSTMKRPSTTDIGNDTSKKYMQTIPNLVQSSTTNSTLPSNGVTNTSVAIPSPVSSTSSLSSISIPSRLGSSTPPVACVPSAPVSISQQSNSSANSNSQPIQVKPPLSSIGDINSQQISANPITSSALPTPIMLTSPSHLSLPPTLNGPLMGLPMNPSMSASYRPLYPTYGLYPPYGLHPYQAIPNPALSPRSLAEQQRRDPSMHMSKPMKTHSPNSASPMPHQPSSVMPGAPVGSAPSNHHHQESPSRNHSPMREKESILSKSMASTSNSVSSSVISQPATAFTNSTSMFNQPQTMGLSAANSYPISSLSYQKAPGILPPNSWPHPSSMSTPPVVPVSSSLVPTLTRPLPVSTSPHPGSYSSPLFTAPLPPTALPQAPAPLPFSAESLLSNKNDQADLIRRELDNRFLDRTISQPPMSNSSQAMHPSQSPSNSTSSNQSISQSAPPVITSAQPPTSSSTTPGPPNAQPPSPFMRQELHHHQHQHTHLHQHQHQSLLPTQPTSSLFPPPLFKDIPKIGAVDSPFYRTAPAMVSGINYAYPSGLLHQGSTPFVPPAHLQSFTPKQHVNPAVVDPTKPKPVKTGRWNAMHVRIAWEIYHHQAKQNPDKVSSVAGVKPEMSRGGHAPYLTASSPNMQRPHEMNSAPSPSYPPRTFDPMTANYLSPPSSHLGIPPIGLSRYTPFTSPFNSLSPYVRDMPIDPWRRPLGAYPPPPTPLGTSWPLKPDPGLDAARREAEERERERQRREKEERDRKEKEREEKLKREREEREREQREREQREREQREREQRERKERERRDMEARERERMIQQQRLNDASKAAAQARERSPMRNGDDIRVKEEPRKDENEMMMRAAEQRVYQQSLAAWQMTARHPHMFAAPRPGLFPMPPHPHYASLGPQGPPGWPSPLDPYRDPYRLMDPMMRAYPPMNSMLDPLRVDPSAHYRKNPSPLPSPMHPQMKQLGSSSQMSQNPMQIASNELHKKEDLSR